LVSQHLSIGNCSVQLNRRCVDVKNLPVQLSLAPVSALELAAPDLHSPPYVSRFDKLCSGPARNLLDDFLTGFDWIVHVARSSPSKLIGLFVVTTLL
jgi:hypothetical protein